MIEKLALNGGQPVRSKPLPPYYPGAVSYGEEEKLEVLEVLERKSPFRYYGPDVAGKVRKFETYLADKTGSKHVLAVTSGTASLVVALKALEIGPGDQVIVPANTFLATAGAVVIAGAIPVFADVDDSLNIDPNDIARLVNDRTKAVIPVHILGNPCEMDKVMSISRQHHLAVIEDVAQSCGCTYQGKAAGTFGDMGCFSLQMNKIITTGDGGAVVTDDPSLYERAVRYHDQGMFREREGFLGMKEEDDIFIGQNYRMSEVTGAIALAQIRKLDAIITKMRQTKKWIKSQIQDIKAITFRRINDEAGDAGNALFLLLPSAEKAAEFRAALNAENISTSWLYNGNPVYKLPQIFNQRTVDRNGFPFNQIPGGIKYTSGMCPNAENLLSRNALIYLGPLIETKDATDIVKGIRKVAQNIF